MIAFDGLGRQRSVQVAGRTTHYHYRPGQLPPVANTLADGKAQIDKDSLQRLRSLFGTMLFDLLGLVATDESASGGNEELADVMKLVLDLRQKAKSAKDWPTADLIRNSLAQMGITVKDTKEGAEWLLNE